MTTIFFLQVNKTADYDLEDFFTMEKQFSAANEMFFHFFFETSVINAWSEWRKRISFGRGSFFLKGAEGMMPLTL